MGPRELDAQQQSVCSLAMTAQRCWNSGFSSEMTSDKKQGKQDIRREAEGKSKNVSRWPTMCQALYICYLIEQDEIMDKRMWWFALPP